MICPNCGGRSSVKDTFDACDVVFRRHLCMVCPSTWVSEERLVPGSLHKIGDRRRTKPEVPTEYGPGWGRIRSSILARDGHRCTVCQSIEGLHVHHIKPLLSFNGDTEAANQPENLLTLCVGCHLAAHGKRNRS